MNRSISTFVLVSALTACGGGSGNGSGLCDAICERELSCDPEATTCDRTECEGFAPNLRSQAEAAMTTCFQNLACADSDDQCLADAIDAVSERAIDTEFVAECSAAVDTCDITDDFCFISVLFEEANVENAVDCLDQPCAEIETCLENAFGV